MAIPKPEKRIAEFENFGLGMFVHWGLYSQMGRGEWIQHQAQIPREEYMKLAQTFTASKFDARAWAATAKAAGARYITLTARHHEGFSLYDTRGLTTYDAPHTPCRRDLIREFVDACRRVGANYLLNVGPTGEGEISLMQQAILHGIGDWIAATGNGIYTGKPCGVAGEGKNFALRDGNKMYLYVHDLSIVGDANVTVASGGAGTKTFTGVEGTVESIRWTDCDEALNFTQDGSQLTVDCTGYPYGKNLVVRVAEAEIA